MYFILQRFNLETLFLVTLLQIPRFIVEVFENDLEFLGIQTKVLNWNHKHRTSLLEIPQSISRIPLVIGITGQCSLGDFEFKSGKIGTPTEVRND